MGPTSRLGRVAAIVCCAFATAPAAAPAAPAGNAHVSAQADGHQADGRPQPPLTQLWTRDLVPQVFAAAPRPVVAGGRVFQLSEEPIGFTIRLSALDLATGRVLWERLLAAGDARVAAGEDTVVVAQQGVTQAFAAADGVTRWLSHYGAGDRLSVDPPVIDADLLLTVGDSPELVARSLDDGAVRWTRDSAVAGRDVVTPAVAGDRVIVNDGCGTSALDRTDGDVLWGPVAGDPGCGHLPRVAVHAGRVVVAGAFDASTDVPERLQVLDLADGSELGRPVSELAHHGSTTAEFATRPALAGNVAYALEDGGVTARELPSGAVQWQTPVEGASRTISLSGDTVFVPTSTGIVALDRLTGAESWGGGDPAEGRPVAAIPSDGVLVVANTHGLTAWSDGDPGPGFERVPAGGPAPAPARPGDEARTLGQSVARDGALTDPGGLAAPLARRWQRDVGGRILYGALTDGELAYVATTSASRGRRIVVEAFELATGRSRWRRTVHAYSATGSARLGVGGGVLVVLLDHGTLQAFDATTGDALWRRTIVAQGGDGMIVDAGRVFTLLGPARRLAAYDLRSGEPLWETPLELPAHTNLSSDGTTIYTGSQCGPVAAVAIADGAVRWRRDAALTICTFTTPVPEPAPVVHGDEVLSDEGAVRRRSDGVVIDLMAGGGRVAAAGHMRVGIDGSRVQAIDSRGRLQWITPPRTIGAGYGGRPIIAGPTVFVSGAASGEIQALDLATGDVTWSDTPFETGTTLTARPGTLLAAHSEQLVAYGPATPGPVIRLRPPESPTPQRRPALSWEADGATFTSCSIDGGPAAACMSGFTPPADLADGEHTITVATTGLGGTTTSTAVVRVDTTAPDTAIVSGPPAFDRGNEVHPLKWEVDEVGAGVECRLDGVLVSTDCEEDTFLTFNVADGPHELTLTAYDLANNVEAQPAVHRWTRDSRAPEVTITRAPPARSNDATPEVEFSGDEEGLTFTCSGRPCTSPARLAELFGPYADGSSGVTIVARDRAGNVGPGAGVSFTIDTTAPAARIDSGPPALTNAAEVQIAFEAVEPATGVECRLDDSGWQACTSPRTVGTGADGDHTFAVRTVDDLGNRGAATTRTWRTDRTPPVLSLDSAPAPHSNAVPHRFSLRASEQGTLACRLDAVARTSCEQFYDLADGEHTISWQLTDRAGNAASSVPPPHTWVVDTRPPVVTITGGPTGRTRERDVSFAIGADEDGVTFACEESGVSIGPCPPTLARTGLEDGHYGLRVDAIDRAGNPAGASRYWVVDAHGPVARIYGGDVFAGDTAQLQFGGESPSDTWRCTVDARPAFACAPPQADVGGLAPGEHAMVIVGTDDLGNVGPPVTVRWTQLAPNPPFVLPAPPAPVQPVQPPADSAPRAIALSAAATTRLRRDTRTTVRGLARRGGRLARVKTVTFASKVPLPGRLRATLRLGSRTVGKASRTMKRAGSLRLRVKLTVAGRRALRRPGGRLELRVSFRPSGGRVTSVRAGATRRRR